jgi:serine/threonine protein kinase
VYAFGCLAFEALTGRTLFHSPSEMAQVSMHLAHDGFPDPLRALAGEHPALAELLFSTLRHDPANRPTVDRVRAELARLAPQLGRLRWPLGAPAPARARG